MSSSANRAPSLPFPPPHHIFHTPPFLEQPQGWPPFLFSPLYRLRLCSTPPPLIPTPPQLPPLCLPLILFFLLYALHRRLVLPPCYFTLFQDVPSIPPYSLIPPLPHDVSFSIYAVIQACSRLKFPTFRLHLVSCFSQDDFGEVLEKCLPNTYKAQLWPFIPQY